MSAKMSAFLVVGTYALIAWDLWQAVTLVEERVQNVSLAFTMLATLTVVSGVAAATSSRQWMTRWVYANVALLFAGVVVMVWMSVSTGGQ